ncbi:MAG: contractile injection system tape measure protein, partial [Synechococcaceae cyanobacterium]
MAPPAHHLRRLRLQVHTADQASGQALRSRFEAGLSRRLADVVAAVCDELGPQEELLRIDRLNLPLGAFALEELEREAPLALERALRDALLQALAAARHNPAPGQRLLAPAEARLDRLATFLRLGLLPHRVASEPFAPADDLLALLRADPASLLALLRRLAGERSALERLLLQLDPERFALLLAALAPADAALILAYLADLLLLHQQRPLLAIDGDRLRRSLWLVTLTLLLRDPGSPFNRRTFLDQLLRGLAAEHRLPYGLLLRQLEQALRAYSRVQPLGGSLPALLAELIGLRRSLAPALARANRDPEPLLALLRADPDNPALHRALEPRLSEPLFAALVQALEPEQAPLVLATVADVALVHRQQPLLPLAADPFERLVRRIALQLLLHPTSSPFERLSFLRQLLRQLAQSQQLAYTDLLRTFAIALRRLPRPFPLQTSLPALLDSLLAVELGGGVQAVASPATDQGFAAAIRPEAGDAERADANLSPSPSPSPSSSRLPPPPFAAQLWNAFLRDGHPAHLGPRLQAAVEGDPASFAALLRSLFVDAGPRPGEATPPASPAAHRQILLARLLRWLLPEALAALAAAASAEPHPPPLLFARWAEWLADAPGADLAVAWGQLLSQRLAEPVAPLPALPALAAGHLDRRALLRVWLGLASPPPWLAPPPELPQWVAPLLRGASELELRRLLQIPPAPPAALLLALQRLQGLLAAPPQPIGPSSDAAPDAAVFDQLLERLLPWLQQPTGPLAAALARASSPAERQVVRLQAVALALAGAPLTLEALQRALPPLPAPASAAGVLAQDAPQRLAPAATAVVGPGVGGAPRPRLRRNSGP